MKYSMRRTIYLATLFGGNIIGIVGLLIGQTVVFGIGFGLVILSYLLEMVLLRCPKCNTRVAGKGFWAGLPYVIGQARVRKCQNPSCGLDFD